MNIFGRLIPWWAFALAGIAVGGLLAGMAQQQRVSGIKTEFADYKTAQAALWAKQARLTADALTEARAKDDEIERQRRALETTITNNAKEAFDAEKKHSDDLAAAERVADGLRGQLRTIARGYAGLRDKAASDAAAAANLAPASAAVGVLVDLYERCDSRAGKVADFADRSYAAGQRCERDYDAAYNALRGR